MCGRFSFNQAPETVAKLFQLANVPQLPARYNIAPTQPVPTVLQIAESQRREFQMLRWGLIPSWAKDAKIGSKLINARAETVMEKPSFRSPFRHRRCLILADGFYEWQNQEGRKQPFYFKMENGQPFAFAGLWDRWESPEGEAIASCTILTTEPNEITCPIHNRMPVILHSEDYDRWLDTSGNPSDLLRSLRPYESVAMTCYPVNTTVNSPKSDRPECVQPIAEMES